MLARLLKQELITKKYHIIYNYMYKRVSFVRLSYAKT